MDFKESTIMYAMGIAVVIFVIAQSLFFMVKSWKRAKEIGMRNTLFVTPSGLDSEGHSSTAYDMALLMAEAMLNKEFREAAATVKTEVTFGSPSRTATFSNHNKLLTDYNGMLGGKTGYTRKSGRCLPLFFIVFHQSSFM